MCNYYHGNTLWVISGFPSLDAVFALHVTSHRGFVPEVSADVAPDLFLHQVWVSKVPAIRDVPKVLIIFAALAPGAVLFVQVQTPPVGKLFLAYFAFMLQKCLKNH